MKRKRVMVLILLLSFLPLSCAYYPDRYNTQAGAVVGAGTGALLGQAIGGSAESTLIGLAAGTIMGALVGNAIDQDYQAAREAAQYNRPVIYYDNKGQAVEAIPEGMINSNCQRVRKRIYENGKLVKENVEEICGAPAVAQYSPAPPPPVYYPAPPPPYYYYDYGWWGPVYGPRYSFYFGRPYYRGYYHHYHGWHRW